MKRSLTACTLLLAIVPMVGCAYCANPQDYCGPVFGDGCTAQCDCDSRSGSVYGVSDVEVYVDEYSSTGSYVEEGYYAEEVYDGDEFYEESVHEPVEYVDDRDLNRGEMYYRHEERYGDEERNVNASGRKPVHTQSRMYEQNDEGPRKRRVLPVSYEEPITDVAIPGTAQQRASR